MQKSEIFLNCELSSPLKKTDLNNLFIKKYNGDLNARNIIIEHNIRLVISTVLRFFSNTMYDKNELVSIGLIGLIKSVDSFDINKNRNFSDYAIICIRNEIGMFFQKNDKYFINDKSLENYFISDKLKLENVLYDDKTNITSNLEQKELINFVILKINNLPEREKIIIKKYFGIGCKQMKQKDIAKEFNMNAPNISKIIKSSLKKLKLILESYYMMDKNTKKYYYKSY